MDITTHHTVVNRTISPTAIRRPTLTNHGTRGTRSAKSEPGTALMTLPDGTEYRLTTLLSRANHKQIKGREYLSVGLTLTPRDSGGSGRNLCPFASAGCAATCLANSDRLAWPASKRAALARTLLLARNQERFRSMLVSELRRAEVRANGKGVPLVVRLNVVSDVPWERRWPGLFDAFPGVQFMDYTKDLNRITRPELPANYHLTFSRSETNEADCRRVLDAGGTVSVVFRRPPFPDSFWGYPVIDGDQDDLRFLDPPSVVVGLKAKGKARRDHSGFVVDI